MGNIRSCAGVVQDEPAIEQNVTNQADFESCQIMFLPRGIPKPLRHFRNEEIVGNKGSPVFFSEMFDSRMRNNCNYPFLYIGRKEIKPIDTNIMCEELFSKIQARGEEKKVLVVYFSMHQKDIEAYVVTRICIKPVHVYMTSEKLCTHEFCSIGQYKVVVTGESELLNFFQDCLMLPDDYPESLLYHYITCRNFECKVGPAFYRDERLELEFELKHEKNIALTNVNDNLHHCWIFEKDILLLEHVREKMKVAMNHPEATQVRNEVNRFVTNLCKLLHQIPIWSNVTFELVGSMKEETRAYFPDEYDFSLIMREDLVKCIHRNRWSKLELQSGNHKNITVCGPCIEDNIYRPMRVSLDSLPCTISQEMGLHFQNNKKYENEKFITVFLRWNGQRFKELKIGIDLVPVMRHEVFSECLPQHSFINFELYREHIGVTFTRNNPYTKLDFSKLENEFLRKLPENIRNGYTLAKAIRVLGAMFSIKDSIINCNAKYDICKIVKSYMLKTSLLFLTQSLDPAHISVGYSDVYWARGIYEQLLEFVVLYLEIPSFFNPNFLIQKYAVAYLHSDDLLAILLVIGRALQLFHSHPGHPDQRSNIVPDELLIEIDTFSKTRDIDIFRRQFREMTFHNHAG